jgi:protein SEY1
VIGLLTWSPPLRIQVHFNLLECHSNFGRLLKPDESGLLAPRALSHRNRLIVSVCVRYILHYSSLPTIAHQRHTTRFRTVLVVRGHSHTQFSIPSLAAHISPIRGMSHSSIAVLPSTTTMNDAADKSAMMQVVDYEETFHTGLGPFLKRSSLAVRGFDYHVVAVMGPQSSGKSTLLNILFGTTFRTMEADAGRYQVTQGVWLGQDTDEEVVILDLEGTDSRERGEDAATFERKSSLFALALADVLIVNIWTQDVGRFNASNLSLLKTVLELDMQLFYGGSSNAASPADCDPRMHKSRLLFVLRDHYAVSVGGTPVERLEAILRADVDNIWASIAKPEAAKNTSVSDYFDLDFYALPHKVLDPEGFKNGGRELKRRFKDGDLYRDEYKRGIAADGFASYAESVWETVRANKELDIPTQKEMLAHVRCEQIAREAADKVEQALTPLRAVLLTPRPFAVTGLYASMLAAVNDAVQEYSEAANRYSQPVAEMKAFDLHNKLSSECKELYDAQATVVSDAAVAKFRRAIAEISTREAPWNTWGELSHGAYTSALEMFEEKCKAGSLPPSQMPPAVNPHPLSFVASSFEGGRARLVVALQDEMDRATANVTASALAGCLKTFQDAFKPPLNMVLDHANEDVWQRASEVSTSAWEKTTARAAVVYGPSGLGFDNDALDEAVEDKLKPECYERAVKTTRDTVGSSSNFLMRMTKRFEDRFRFDDRGVPRHFGPDEDIETLYMDARDEGEKLATLLAEVQLSGSLTRLRPTARPVDKETSDCVIFESHDQADLAEKLRRHAGAVFMEAKRAQEAAKVTTKVPPWLFILLIILGWNEIMMVLKNPLLLILTVLVVPALYVGYSMDATNMLLPAVKAAATPYLIQARDMMDQYVPQEQHNAPAAVARPVEPAMSAVPQ